RLWVKTRNYTDNERLKRVPGTFWETQCASKISGGQRNFMIMNRQTLSRALPKLAGILLFSLLVGVLLAGCSHNAGSTASTPDGPPHLNLVQKHPTLTAIGAGVATHQALKAAANNAKAHGKKLNWAERHPTLTAVGVGVVTHHEIKKHTPVEAH